MRTCFRRIAPPAIQGILFVCLLAASLPQCLGEDFYVSPMGSDTNAGTLERPWATLVRARTAVRKIAGKETAHIFLRGGTYYLRETFVFTAQDSGTAGAPVVYQAYQQERAVISGGVKLNLKWEPYTNGVFQSQAPVDLKTEEIFVNGQRQILARYPNFDPTASYFDGYAPDAISVERARRWADAAGGYFHAMHPALWGDFTWRIMGKDSNGGVTLEGGWQNNRGGGKPHATYRFVENIFEELDAPGEWFLNPKTHLLYYYPPPGLALSTATIEATRLRSLIEFQGGEHKPARFITLRGLVFRQASRTVMDTREPLLRSDWAIYRGGAIFINGAEDCALEDCFLDQLGGNAIFVNNFNRRVIIRGCHIAEAGANGVCFVGDPNAARSPLFKSGNWLHS